MSLTQPEVMQKLDSIEREYDCFDLQIGGTPIWEYIKPSIITSARTKHTHSGSGNFNKRGDTKTDLDGLISFCKNTLSYNYSPLLLPNCDILIYGFSRRKLGRDNKMIDHISDPFGEILTKIGYSWALLENPISAAPGYHYKSNKTPNKNLFYNDFNHFLPRIMSRLHLKNYKLSRNEKKDIRFISQKVDSSLGVSMSTWPSEQYESIIEYRQVQIKLYDWILERVDPLILVVVNRDRARPLIEVARNKNIPVVELQHGVINELHPGFRYPDEAVPATAPTHFFTWGKEWGERINVSQFTLENIGYPYSNKEYNRVSSIKKSNRIVIFSQHFCGNRMANIAIKLANLFAGSNTEIVFKPHPIVGTCVENFYPQLQGSSVVTFTDQQPDLYELFATSQAQVGVSSTTLFEGLRFNLKTYVVDEYTCTYMDDLLSKDYAKMVSSAEEIYNDYISNEKMELNMTPYFSEIDLEQISGTLSEIAQTQTKF